MGDLLIAAIRNFKCDRAVDYACSPVPYAFATRLLTGSYISILTGYVHLQRV
jgi:hypothetical protein